jgi:hypothetical protein
MSTFPAVLFNVLIFPPPLLMPLLAGLLARRSSYLAGLIVALIAAVLFGAWVLFSTFPPSSTGTLISNDIRVENAVYAIVSSVVSGLLMGAIGGFGRRLVLMLRAE